MKFRRPPTKVQATMMALMGIAVAALIGWSVPELIGAFGHCVECTYSEWVWDLPLWAVLAISAVQLIVGFLAIGSVWHYLEGWVRRRRAEKK